MIPCSSAQTVTLLSCPKAYSCPTARPHTLHRHPSGVRPSPVFYTNFRSNPASSNEHCMPYSASSAFSRSRSTFCPSPQKPSKFVLAPSSAHLCLLIYALKLQISFRSKSHTPAPPFTPSSKLPRFPLPCFLPHPPLHCCHPRSSLTPTANYTRCPTKLT